MKPILVRSSFGQIITGCLSILKQAIHIIVWNFKTHRTGSCLHEPKSLWGNRPNSKMEVWVGEDINHCFIIAPNWHPCRYIPLHRLVFTSLCSTDSFFNKPKSLWGKQLKPKMVIWVNEDDLIWVRYWFGSLWAGFRSTGSYRHEPESLFWKRQN